VTDGATAGADAWSSLVYYTAGSLEVARHLPATCLACRLALAPSRLALLSLMPACSLPASVPGQEAPRLLPLPVEASKKKAGKKGQEEEAPPPPQVGVFEKGPLTYAAMRGLRWLIRLVHAPRASGFLF
jgi:hypothetical protein